MTFRFIWDGGNGECPEIVGMDGLFKVGSTSSSMLKRVFALSCYRVASLRPIEVFPV